MNCDLNDDGKPDTNIDYNDDKEPHFNIDDDGDGKVDENLTNQDKDKDGVCDLNCDTNDDGWPDKNIDFNGDGVCDQNCDIDVYEGEEYVLKFSDGLDMNQPNITPGWKGSKNFTITNKTDEAQTFKLEWINVTNTFTEVNNLYYKITRDNNVVKDSLRTPYNSAVILDNITIPAYKSYVYTFEFEFKETNVNQDVDKNKLFDGTIKITVY